MSLNSQSCFPVFQFCNTVIFAIHLSVTISVLIFAHSVIWKFCQFLACTFVPRGKSVAPSKVYFGQHNISSMLNILAPLHAMMKRTETLREVRARTHMCGAHFCLSVNLNPIFENSLYHNRYRPLNIVAPSPSRCPHWKWPLGLYHPPLYLLRKKQVESSPSSWQFGPIWCPLEVAFLHL